MKQEPKKQEAPAPSMPKVEVKKESSGDKLFDAAIDLLLKKPARLSTSK